MRGRLFDKNAILDLGDTDKKWQNVYCGNNHIPQASQPLYHWGGFNAWV